MAARWGLYLTTLLGCLVFYIFYQEWLSTVLLWIVLLLPWLSLAISLPAICTMNISLEGASIVTTGTQAIVAAQPSCPMPPVPFYARLRLRHLPTGKTVVLKNGGTLPTAHCGGVSVDLGRVWVRDYLGLFAFPIRFEMPRTTIVRPTPLPTTMPAGLDRVLNRSWRPKPGGGFSEQHEIRPYREGDSLSHIHWKLTAKVGQLMLREPMQPERHRVVITLDWCGTAEEIDRKCGRLRFVGQYLLAHELKFEVVAAVQGGVWQHAVHSPEELLTALDGLLCCAPTKTPMGGEDVCDATWQCYIGGEPDEA